MNSWGFGSVLTALLAITLVAGVVIFKAAFVITDQYTNKIVKRFGKFMRVLEPGPSWILPFIESATPSISTKVEISTITTELKTRDGAFPTILIRIHYRIFNPIASSQMANLEAQLDTLVKTFARPQIAGQNFATIYEQPEIMTQMAAAFRAHLKEKMDAYGLTIHDVLIETPSISEALRNAMQGVIISERELAATVNKAKKTEIEITAVARGEAEGKKAIGDGIAYQQKAIAKAFSEALDDMTKPGLLPQDTLQFLLTQGYYQLLERIAQIQSTMTDARLFALAPSSIGGSPSNSQNKIEDDLMRMIPIISAAQEIMKQQPTEARSTGEPTGTASS